MFDKYSWLKLGNYNINNTTPKEDNELNICTPYGTIIIKTLENFNNKNKSTSVTFLYGNDYCSTPYNFFSVLYKGDIFEHIYKHGIEEKDIIEFFINNSCSYKIIADIIGFKLEYDNKIDIAYFKKDFNYTDNIIRKNEKIKTILLDFFNNNK